MTKNMIESYAQDSIVIDTIAHAFMSTNTIMDFFTNTSVSIDQLNYTQLNLDWTDANVGVNSEMYNLYATVPFYYNEVEPVFEPRIGGQQ